MTTVAAEPSSELDHLAAALRACWQALAVQEPDLTLSQWLADVRPWLPASLREVPADRLAAAAARLRQDHAGMSFLDQSSGAEGPSPLPPWPEVPGFRAGTPLGEGGMGVVYKAWQEQPGRWVALKMLPPGRRVSAERRQRFLAEPQVMAQLHHTHIVQVYVTGEHRGVPYFAMELVEGGSLARRLAGRPQEPAFAAQLVLQLAQALQHAHDLGVVHRDMKPANVLLAGSDPPSAHSHAEESRPAERGPPTALPKITDFGVAKYAERDWTASGMVLGTPSYMAPEQARGDAKQVGPAADIYALGAILFEMLTGQPPFRGGNTMETLLLVQDAAVDAPPVRQVRPEVPADLAAVCGKCLEKAPHRRYPRAAALARDLGRFLEGRSVSARVPGPWERTRRWCERHRTVALLLIGIMLSLAAGTLASLWFAWQEHQARQAEVEENQRHQRTQRELEREDYFHRIQRAAHLWDTGDVAAMEPLLDGCPAHLRHWEWHYLYRLCRAEEARWRLPLHGGDVCFSPNGRWFALNRSGGQVFLWDLTTGHTRLLLATDAVDGTVCMAFSPDSRLLAVSNGKRGQIWIHDPATGQVLQQLPQSACIGLAFTPDGRHLLAAERATSQVCIWSVPEGRCVARIGGHDKLKVVAAHPNGRQAASADDRGMIQIWDVPSGRVRHRFPGTGRRIVCLAYDPQGRYLAAGSGVEDPRLNEQAELTVWDPTTGQKLHAGRGPDGAFHDLRFTPGGGQLVAIAGDRTIRFWEAGSWEPVRQVLTSEVQHRLIFSADGRQLWTAGPRCLRRWRMSDVQGPRHVRLALGQLPYALAFSSEAASRRLAAAHYDGVLRLWDASTGGLTAEMRVLEESSPVMRWWQVLTGQQGYLRSVAWSRDGQWLATGDCANRVRVWHAATGRLYWQAKLTHGHVDSVAFSPEGRWLAAADHTDQVVLWDAATGARVAVLRGFGEFVTCLAFAPDGSWLAIGGTNGLVHRWDPHQRRRLPSWSIPTHPTSARPSTSSLAFSPDGRWLAVGVCPINQPTQLLLWNAVTHQVQVELPGSTSPFDGLAFTPDGRRLVTVSRDKSIRLWEVPTGKEVLRLPAFSVAPTCAVFSTDGHLLATTGWDRCIRFWNGRPAIGP